MYLIIIGAGSIGSQLIKLATKQNNDVVVIENNSEVAERAASTYDCLVINGDATVIDTLDEAGAHQADAIISTTDKDATNIMVMLLAQELKIPSLVSVVHNPAHMQVFRQIGVNVLENPQHLIAEYLYRAVQRPSVKDFMHLGDNAEVFEITATQGSKIAGMSLLEADEQGLFGDDVLIVAIQRDQSVITPRGETAIQAGDLVTVFSKRGFAPDVMQLFMDEE
ncbi:potassium channel family protein [Haladaptatus pallidirubidus]|uniref:TrkA family potassium uptake protein n=1 Tax=Haladaptatus pallidirubidus TaxID=1008152 RepID=A0AAV3UH38_9EURY|nr:TrkA family potassium uptake protein [Haladaptatus pallidirubidus]